MKLKDKLKTFALRVRRVRALKYVVVCIIGVAIVGFLDENSVLNHVKNQHRISELEEEIESYNATFARSQAQIRELNNNPKAMEKIARERYFMKADDEDIFVLSDDEPAIKSIPEHETAE